MSLGLVSGGRASPLSRGTWACGWYMKKNKQKKHTHAHGYETPSALMHGRLSVRAQIDDLISNNFLKDKLELQQLGCRWPESGQGSLPL